MDDAPKSGPGNGKVAVMCVDGGGPTKFGMRFKPGQTTAVDLLLFEVRVLKQEGDSVGRLVHASRFLGLLLGMTKKRVRRDKLGLPNNVLTVVSRHAEKQFQITVCDLAKRAGGLIASYERSQLAQLKCSAKSIARIVEDADNGTVRGVRQIDDISKEFRDRSHWAIEFFRLLKSDGSPHGPSEENLKLVRQAVDEAGPGAGVKQIATAVKNIRGQGLRPKTIGDCLDRLEKRGEIHPVPGRRRRR